MPPQIENQINPENIEPKQKFTKLIKFILIIIGVLVIITTAILFFKLVFTPIGPMPQDLQDSLKKYRESQNLAVSTSTDKFVDWKTYRNEQYGFEFKYPINSSITEDFGKAVNNFLVKDAQNNYIFSLQIYPTKSDENIQTWLQNFSSQIKYTTTPINLNGYEAFYAVSNSSVADSFYIIKNKNQIFLFNDSGIDIKEILSTFKFIPSTNSGQVSTSTPLDTSISDPQTYTACGCGCCGGEKPTRTQCLYHAKGDDIKKIIAVDKQQSQSSVCSTVGCGLGVEYKYCD
jgi:hypothetical protein